MKILEVKKLSFNYGEKQVINNLNMSVQEGTFVTIIGGNSSGKTTLIKLICGLLDSKESIIANYSFVDSSKIHYNSKLFGVVFSTSKNKFLFDNVYKEMTFPLENLNMEKKEIEKTVIDMAKEFKNPKILDKKIDALTEAEKQVLQIMIALLHKPKILLLDSPFTMISKKEKEKIIEILNKKVMKDNLTVILTTTNLEDIINSDYSYIISDGTLVMEGTPLSILKEDTLLTKAGLELPFMIDLSHKLKFYELIDEEILDMDRMVDTLWK